MSLEKLLIQQCKEPQGWLGQLMLKIMNTTYHRTIIWALSTVEKQDNLTILDIGCGGGKVLKILSQSYKNSAVFGVDIAIEAINSSTRLNKQAVDDGKVVITQASVSELPYNNDYFDLVTAFHTHYFWPNLTSDLQEVLRVVKVNGKFILVSELYKMKYHLTEFNDIDTTLELLSGLFSSVEIYFQNKSVCFVCTK